MADLWGVAERIVSWSGSLWFWFYSQGVLARADWRALWFRKHPTSPQSKWMWQVAMGKKTKTKKNKKQKRNKDTTVKLQTVKTSACSSFFPSLLYMVLHLEHNQPERQVMEQFQFDASCLFPFTSTFSIKLKLGNSVKGWGGEMKLNVAIPMKHTCWKNICVSSVSFAVFSKRWDEQVERNFGVNYWRINH